MTQPLIPTNHWRGIRPGDTVHYSTPQGNKAKGVVRISTSTHVVLNGGGRHGTPVVVDENNFMSHTLARK